MKELKTQLRRELCQRRSEITDSEKALAQKQIAKQLFQTPAYQNAQHVAFYLPNPNEVPTFEILNQALIDQKNCYLPVLGIDRAMHFIHFTKDTSLQKNRYGVWEPEFDLSNEIKPQDLDLALIPLVGFDDACHRLGMGGGFYDNTFAFRRKKVKPILIGLAFECQRVSQVPTSYHDVVLDTVITEIAAYIPQN